MKQKLTIITFTLLAVLAVWWLSSGPGSAFPSRLLLVATVLVYGLLLTGLHRTADRKKCTKRCGRTMSGSKKKLRTGRKN